MSFFDTIIINTICILLPELIYIIYQARINNYESYEFEDNIFELVLLSTLFLIIKLTGEKYNQYSIVLINIPILFAYIRGKNTFALVLSGMLVLYFYAILNYNFVYLIIEYISYYLLYLVYFKSNNVTVSKTIFLYTLVKSFFFSIYIYYVNINSGFFPIFNMIFISMLTFYICSNLYYMFLRKGEEIIDLNCSLKELEKEKTLRNSLFKLTHEIKNPIAVCKGYLDMINLNDSKTTLKYLNIIKNEIGRTLTIMDDFLDITKVKVEKNIMDINYLLEDVVDSMNPLFKKNNVKFETKLLDEEVYINGDYNRLKQVFINIIKNAIESKSEKRNLIVKINCVLEKSNFLITVEDNGVGMTNEELNELGNAFYTTKNKGTGLGVLLSKEIIELHNGTIVYTSIKDKGTAVDIKIPIEDF